MGGTFNKVHLIRQVDLFTLKLFLSVVEECQVGRAATRENIAASAATKRIQDLEDIVGLQLFERNPRGVQPSPAGLVLARHVRHIFDTLEDVRRDFAELTEGVRGTIRIASTGAIIMRFLSAEIADFASSFPMVEIDLREGTNPEVVRAVSSGEVDMAVFVASPGERHEAVDCTDWRTDQLVAVVSRSHPLAQRTKVKAVELLAHNLIAISPSTTIMANVRHEAARHGIEFRPKYAVNSVYAATSLVRVNQGVTIQPGYMLSAQDLEFVQAVALDETWAKRRLCLATQKGRDPTAATKSFLSHLSSRPAA